ncbi:subtilisin inhibitor 1-like [Mangifera indica]|uniref:subtilisin inhibitor 1-like n=1 Tax=Mangifera indica TaxID=29780 RepID=UPI001CFB94BE|nr:subtilisin inhibitor 1-like [Mangifera indica]
MWCIAVAKVIGLAHLESSPNGKTEYGIEKKISKKWLLLIQGRLPAYNYLPVCYLFIAEENKPTEPSKEQLDQSTPILPSQELTGQPLGTNMATKTTWPELVGLAADEAEKKIKEERPAVQIQIVPSNSFVTMDFTQNQV